MLDAGRGIVKGGGAGFAAARARGRKGGRPPVMTPDKVKVARQMYEARGSHRRGHRQDTRGKSEDDLPTPRVRLQSPGGLLPVGATKWIR